MPAHDTKYDAMAGSIRFRFAGALFENENYNFCFYKNNVNKDVIKIFFILIQ